MNLATSLLCLFAVTSAIFAANSEASKITHTFFIAGAETAILDNDGEPLWSYPAATRDGFVLPNGNLLLALSVNKDYPGGAVVEVTRENKVVFEFKGTQSEVNTAQPLPNGNIMLTEAGAKPRLLEVTRDKKVVWTFVREKKGSIHEFQILDTNGTPIEGAPMK